MFPYRKDDYKEEGNSLFYEESDRKMRSNGYKLLLG